MVADYFAGDDGRVLIICPAAVVSAWIAHAAQSHRSRDVRSIGGVGESASGSIDRFMNGTHWLVVSYDYFVLHNSAFRRHGAGRVAMLVLDEAHLLGQAATQRRQCVSMFPAARQLLLTATPCSNDMEQLWSLLDLAEPGCAAERELWRLMVVDPFASGSTSLFATKAKVWFYALVEKYLLRRQRPVG